MYVAQFKPNPELNRCWRTRRDEPWQNFKRKSTTGTKYDGKLSLGYNGQTNLEPKEKLFHLLYHLIVFREMKKFKS